LLEVVLVSVPVCCEPDETGLKLLPGLGEAVTPAGKEYVKLAEVGELAVV
jgi:hypothetical protein